MTKIGNRKNQESDWHNLLEIKDELIDNINCDDV